MSAVSSRAGRVVHLCDHALERLPAGEARDELAVVRARLVGPLRVAIAGREKAGKSTLVNAFLGKRIAPTAVGACTKVVTWFQRGFPERIEVVSRDGTSHDVAFEDGAVPRDLGQEPSSIRRVLVTLSNDALENVTVIDTPGLAAADEASSATTEELLGMDAASRAGIGEADVLVFVFSQTPKDDDRQALDAFGRMLADAEASVVRTVGLLSQADRIAGGWAAAHELAAAFAEALRGRVSSVVPVIGLLAETAACSLTEADAADLKTLAAVPAAERRVMLRSGDLFRSRAPLAPDRRQRILERLGLYGIAASLELVEGGKTTARALTEELHAVSGIDAVQDALDRRFTRHADTIKARDALTALDRLSWRDADEATTRELVWLRSEVEALRLDPHMHRIREVAALEQAIGGESEVPPELVDDLARLVREDSSAARLGLPATAGVPELRDAVREGAARWNRFHAQSGPRDGLIADVAARSYALLWSELAEHEPTAA